MLATSRFQALKGSTASVGAEGAGECRDGSEIVLGILAVHFMEESLAQPLLGVIISLITGAKLVRWAEYGLADGVSSGSR